MAPRNILLLEPPYPNKYPPLGLMKLASHHRQHDNVLFLKSEDPRVLTREWHRVYVTTLFTFEWARTAKTIDFAIRAAAGNPHRVWVGGIAASLMHETFTSEPRWKGVRFIKGLLEHHPAEALQLTDAEILPQESQTPVLPHRRTNTGLRHPGRHNAQVPRTRRLLRLRIPRLHKKMLLLRRTRPGGRPQRLPSHHDPGRQHRCRPRGQKRPDPHGQQRRGIPQVPGDHR